jgi:sporulation related protein
MAERYQDRHFAAGDDYDHGGGSNASAKPEGDPLAELARLIGQTDAFAGIGRANLPLQPHAKPVERSPSYDSYDYEAPAEPDDTPPPGPPSWLQRAVRQEAPPPPPQEDDYPSAVHPLHRYAATHPPAEDDYDPDQLFADPPHEPDLSRYDDALYGGLDADTQGAHHAQAYTDDAYAYDEEPNFESEQEPRRRGGVITVVAVLALAVFGVGGAFAYRTYTGSARNGEPPIIRPDAGPIKVMPAPADNGTKAPDRMPTGDGTEKIVPREETPVDLSSRTGPRVVFPPLNQNGSMPLPTSVVPGGPAPVGSGNGTLPNNEPRRVRTLSVRGEPADAGAAAAAAPPAKPASRTAAAAAKPAPAAAASAGAANPNPASPNAPLSLSPQQAAAPEPSVRVAATNPNPAQIAPSAGGASGNYLVQVSSQRSEADAQASFKALQGKFPSVLGSRASVIKRADLGDKGVYYRAMVGPFNSPDEASQFCGSLKSAGGQCVVQRN